MNFQRENTKRRHEREFADANADATQWRQDDGQKGEQTVACTAKREKKTGRTGVYEIIMNIKRPRGRWSHAKRDIAAYVIRSAIFISMMHSKVGSSSSADAGRGRLDWKTFTEPTLSFYSFFYLKSKGRGEICRRKWLCTVDDRPVKPTQKNVVFFLIKCIIYNFGATGLTSHMTRYVITVEREKKNHNVNQLPTPPLLYCRGPAKLFNYCKLF